MKLISPLTETKQVVGAGAATECLFLPLSTGRTGVGPEEKAEGMPTFGLAVGLRERVKNCRNLPLTYPELNIPANSLSS